jgi:putative ATP-dependent endonuclease of OLD family
MKIAQIRVNNFKALAGEHCIDTNNAMICFVGENNTGKTTIFAAIDFLKSGVSKEKSIYDYKNKNHLDQDVSVEIIIQGNIKQAIENFSEAKFTPYVYNEDGIETLRIKRSSEILQITQNKKPIELNVKKIGVFNSENNQFENPTGFDTAINSLFETQFVWSDMQAGDVVDFGSTKILGKLLKEISKNFEASQEWQDFQNAHQAAFLTSDNALSKKSDVLIQEIQSSLSAFYGGAVVKFDFQTPDPASFIKLGDVFVDDGVDTSITEKGSGMQRAFALSVIKVYADFLTKHETDASISKPIFFFIDEPEISLHPKAQAILLNALKEIAKHQQIFVTTHSPYLLKEFGVDVNAVKIVSKTEDKVTIKSSEAMDTIKFSPTLAEVNYFAYNLASADFHNELYGYICDVTQNFTSPKFDEYLCQNHNIQKNKQWKRVERGEVKPAVDVSLMTFIRHTIHHPENSHNAAFTDIELQESIKNMLEIIKTDSFIKLIEGVQE